MKKEKRKRKRERERERERGACQRERHEEMHKKLDLFVAPSKLFFVPKRSSFLLMRKVLGMEELSLKIASGRELWQGRPKFEDTTPRKNIRIIKCVDKLVQKCICISKFASAFTIHGHGVRNTKTRAIKNCSKRKTFVRLS